MMTLLTSPELWIGLGLMLVVWFALGSDGKAQSDARLARVTRKSSSTATATVQESLRMRDPSQDTPLGQFLAGMSSISKLKARFEIAGIQTTPQKFIAKMLVVGVVTFVVIAFVMGKSLMLALLAGILFGLWLPHLSLNRKIKKRHKVFLRLFPDAIDLMVRGLRAGLPIGESFITVSKEVAEPAGSLFGKIAQQTALGVPMEKALGDAATKLGVTEFNFFVTSIILQRETGGNLGEILSNLAEMLRGRHMMKLKIGALSSEARASAYIVGALPIAVTLMLQVISPEYLVPLFQDYRGNMALAAAIGSMTFGAFIMAKMTQLEI